MRLFELADRIPGATLSGQGDPNIVRVDYDSRQVEEGSLFVAIQGLQADGRQFIGQAFEQGAAAVAGCEEAPEAADKPQLIVPDARRALALIAGELAGHPDRQMDLAAVTGTNGKTTTVFLLGEVFAKSLGTSGWLGTLGGRIGETTFDQERTTPEAPDIHRFLTNMRDEGCRAAAMEVSSHALALHRVFGLKFKVAAFTNLSQDHLDFHNDFDSYFSTKASLFRDYDVETAVINVDDPHGRKLLDIAVSPLLTYSLESPADVQATSLDLSHTGIRMTAATPRGEVTFTSPLLGRFNAYNLLCALSVADAMGLPYDDFAAAAAKFSGVRGRLERIDLGERWAFIDYAHTPEALELALRELRRFSPGAVHVVFGCGGDRDREKRPLMGRAAEEYADKVYITTDNPRRERPASIMSDILSGLKEPQNAMTILDRRHAISTALHKLPQNGTLLIAGKGHETYQEVAGVKYPFDDREEVRRYLAERRQ